MSGLFLQRLKVPELANAVENRCALVFQLPIYNGGYSEDHLHVLSDRPNRQGELPVQICTDEIFIPIIIEFPDNSQRGSHVRGPRTYVPPLISVMR